MCRLGSGRRFLGGGHALVVGGGGLGDQLVEGGDEGGRFSRTASLRYGTGPAG